MKEDDIERVFDDRSPFSSIYFGGCFYVVYRVGGARSDDLRLRKVDLGYDTVMRGPVTYVTYDLSPNEPTQFRWDDISDQECIFALVLPFNRVLDVDQESEQEPEGQRTATVLDVSGHRIFDGSRFILPVIWSSEMDDYITDSLPSVAFAPLRTGAKDAHNSDPFRINNAGAI
jgi:hypothetical protein